MRRQDGLRNAQVGKGLHLRQTFECSLFGIGRLIRMGQRSQISRRESRVIVRWSGNGVEVGFDCRHTVQPETTTPGSSLSGS